MTDRLGIGVIGLGPRWRRHYKPALLALRERFEIRAVCDQLGQRAGREAKALGCASAAGPVALLERDDVRAALLLDLQWFGLWPVQLACRFHKPLFCASSLELDDAHADALRQSGRDSGVPILFEMTPRAAGAMMRLREILDHEIGPARLVLGDCVQSSVRPRQRWPGDEEKGPAALFAGLGVSLLDGCVSLLGSEPWRVQAARAEALGFTHLFAECSDGRAVQLTHRRVPHGRLGLSLEVVAERGSARVEMPRQVSWTAKDGRYVQMLNRQRPIYEVLLGQFHQAVTEGGRAEPGLEAAHRALRWLRAGALSQAEARRVELGEEPGRKVTRIERHPLVEEGPGRTAAPPL